MLSLFSKTGTVEINGSGAIIKDATFKRNFGPFKAGEHCKNIKVTFEPHMIQEIGEDGHIIRSQEMTLITANNLLEKIIGWMDDDHNPETLFTRDGRKAYRFYSGTEIDQFLRALYAETH